MHASLHSTLGILHDIHILCTCEHFYLVPARHKRRQSICLLWLSSSVIFVRWKNAMNLLSALSLTGNIWSHRRYEAAKHPFYRHLGNKFAIFVKPFSLYSELGEQFMNNSGCVDGLIARKFWTAVSQWKHGMRNAEFRNHLPTEMQVICMGIYLRSHVFLNDFEHDGILLSSRRKKWPEVSWCEIFLLYTIIICRKTACTNRPVSWRDGYVICLPFFIS